MLAPVSDMSDVAQSPQLAAREFWTPVSHPELSTDVRYPGAFVRFGETPIQYRERPPLLGEHTDEILKNVLRLNDSEVADLRSDEVVA